VETWRKAVAELIGTFVLVLGGCGAACISAGSGAIGVEGVAIAFGLTVVAMAYGIGHISGAHLNPAVSVGAVVGGRMPAKDLPAYVGAQIVGGILAALVLMILLKGGSHWHAILRSGFASNGYGAHSPMGYHLGAVFLAETLLTFIFLLVILGSTDERAPKGIAGLAIGLTLTLIHLVSIPISNTSVNPARSLGPAIFEGGWAIKQVWVFFLAPILGAALAGVTYKAVFAQSEAQAKAAPKVAAGG
jgi:aquaporin Z